MYIYIFVPNLNAFVVVYVFICWIVSNYVSNMNKMFSVYLLEVWAFLLKRKEEARY